MTHTFWATGNVTTPKLMELKKKTNKIIMANANRGTNVRITLWGELADLVDKPSTNDEKPQIIVLTSTRVVKCEGMQNNKFKTLFKKQNRLRHNFKWCRRISNKDDLRNEGLPKPWSTRSKGNNGKVTQKPK